jgi:hypothetical protein
MSVRLERCSTDASDIPLLASPQGGVAARLRKYCEASTDSADGVVFRLRTKKENHPGCVCFGGFAKFFLMTQPPLLAVMQGGEYRSPNPALSHERATGTMFNGLL